MSNLKKTRLFLKFLFGKGVRAGGGGGIGLDLFEKVEKVCSKRGCIFGISYRIFLRVKLYQLFPILKRIAEYRDV